MNEQLTFDFENQKNQDTAGTEQAAVQAKAEQLEAEMAGAYSSLGNRHTYFVSPEGKKQAVKREDALAKAAELEDARTEAAEVRKQELTGQLTSGIKAVKDQKQAEVQNAPSSPEEDDERRAKKEALADMETDELIQAWAKAELDGDDEIAKLAQDELQDQLIRARQDNVYEEGQTSEIIDNIYEMKEEEKSRLIQKQSEASEAEPQAVANPKLSRELRENLEAEEVVATKEASAGEQDESKQKLYDYEEMVKEPVKESKVPSTETVPVSLGEEITEDQKVSLRQRLRHIKNAAMLLPHKLRNREAGKPLSQREKLAWGIGAVAAVAAGYAMYKGFDFGDGTDVSGGGSRNNSVPPEMLTVDTGGSGKTVDQHLLNRAPMDTVPSDMGAAITPESAGIDVSQYSWDVAHQLAPGNEIGTIEGAISRYNELHSTNFALAENAGTTMIMDGARVINSAEMAELNSLMQAA